MARIKKITRQTVDDSMAIAQRARTEARREWVDHLIDAFIAVFPEKKTDLDLVRIDLHEPSDAYSEAQDNVDRVLVNRVTAIVLNHQLDEEERQTNGNH